MDENKYFEVLKQYDLELDDEKVARQVETLLKEHLQENNTKEVKMFLLNRLNHSKNRMKWIQCWLNFQNIYQR